MQLSRVALIFVSLLFCLNLLEIRAYQLIGKEQKIFSFNNVNIGAEIKELVERDFPLFQTETECWAILDSQLEDLRKRTKIDNSTEPRLVLLMDNTTQIFILNTYYWTSIPHNFIIGSAKLWYYDDDFSDGSTLTFEIFISPPSAMDLEKERPCFTMTIPSPEKQAQPHFEHIYFGERNNDSRLDIIVKVSINSHDESQFIKPKSLALRDMTFHLSNEFQNITNSRTRCPLGQGLDENLICQNCSENCGACFGTKPSQCLSCSPGSHWHGFGCINCHGNCEKCTGTTQHECSSCNFGFYNHGNGSCLERCPWPFHGVEVGNEKLCLKACKSNEYAFKYNESCLASCPTPFVSLIGNDGILTCVSPCQSTNDLLFLNGSCSSVCPTPFLVEYFNYQLSFCKHPCSPTEGYLYANRSCLKQCLPPFKIRSDLEVNYCVNPCNPVDLYLYSNGSCSKNCPHPLVEVIQSGARYCRNPCKLMSDFLFINGSCNKECPAPLVERSEPVANFCVNPCDSENLYLFPNGSCFSTCEFPLGRVFDPLVGYCRNPCPSASDYLYFNGSCIKECSLPLQVRTDSIANFCANPCQTEDLYLYQNGSCSPACKAPLVAVSENRIRYCRNPCKSVSDYLYVNRSCLKDCPAPLMVRAEPIANYCVNPCARLNLYLYSNGSCSSTCPFPLRIREEFGTKYCEPPCLLIGEYILRDGSCSAHCPLPLIQRIDISVGTYCLSPCQSNEHFILRNKSCILDCPRDFETKVQYGFKYCLPPCLPEQYYVPQNRSCIEICPHPFKITSEAETNFCSNPCQNSDDFIYDDQSCHQSCPSPFKIEEIGAIGSYCKNPCPEYMNENSDCQEACESPSKIITKGPYKICQINLKRAQPAQQIVVMRKIIKISNTVNEFLGILSCLMNTGDPISLLMMPLLNMFEKIISTDIALPMNTEFILNQGNEWESFVMMAIFSVTSLLISVFLKQSKLDVALRWNTLIPLFIWMSGNQQFELESPRSTLCIFLTIFGVMKIFKVSQRGSEEDNPRWRFLFEVFSENHRFFILILWVRIILTHLTLALLKDFSYFQGLVLILMSFGMCFYLVSNSPIKKILSKIQYLIVEFALLFYNLIFCGLAVFDLSDGLVTDILGQLMNILYLITSVINAFLIVVKILHIIYCQYKAHNSSLVNQIQMSEMNQERDSMAESVRFEPLNQVEEGISENDNNFGESEEEEEEDSIEPSIAIE